METVAPAPTLVPADASAAAAAAVPVPAPPPAPAGRFAQPGHTLQPGQANHSWASDVATQFLTTAFQLFNAVGSWRRTTPAGSEPLVLRASPLIICLLSAAGLLVALCAPKFHMRHRTALVVGVRLSIHLLPSIRSPNVGTALALHRAAQPGAWGAVRDLFRAVTGNRALPALALAYYTMVPPLATLAIAAATTALQWNSSGYCGTPLLSDPLSQRRLAALASALEHAALPLSAVQPLAGQLEPAAVLAGTADPRAACYATYSFLHISIGLLAPVFLSAWVWPPPPPPSTTAAGSSSGCAPWRSKLPAAAHWLSVWATVQLRLATAAAAGPVVRALVLWYVCATLWVICKVEAGL